MPFCLSDTPDRNPVQLSVPEGANASFTCSFPKSVSLTFNWYRMGPGNRSEKLVAFPKDPQLDSRRWHIIPTFSATTQDFYMHLFSAWQNDSGHYVCAAINFAPEIHISESYRQLNVTGGSWASRDDIRDQDRTQVRGQNRDQVGD